MDRRTRRELLDRLKRDADLICARFGLRYRVLEAERANVTSRYGICYSDGTIKIRLRHATTGRPLKYSSLVSTLCHELAHLRHFDHGPSFQRFYSELLGWSRHVGIYRPRRQSVGPARPEPPTAMLPRSPAAAVPAPPATRATPAPPVPRPPQQLLLFELQESEG